MKRYHSLNHEETQIIIKCGTEPSGTGTYNSCVKPGIYVCRQCDMPLYLSNNKFSAHCGWPSFDNELDGAVDRTRDGNRTEITCHRCKAHLGHVFTGENFTPKNTRHCVNSLSIHLTPLFTEEGHERAIFAGGCFWGIEYLSKKLSGLISTAVGYTGGWVVNPTYEEVCSGLTGHAEAIEIIFDPSLINYETIARFFFEIHDPSQLNGQGPDIGTQYRSALFYLSEKQRDIGFECKKILEQRGISITTQIAAGSLFYKAETYHQDHYNKTSKTPYCHRWIKRF